MTLIRFLVSDLSRACYLEALLGTGVCFYLGHLHAFYITPLRRSRTGGTLVGPLQEMVVRHSAEKKNYRFLAGRKDKENLKI